MNTTSPTKKRRKANFSSENVSLKKKLKKPTGSAFQNLRASRNISSTGSPKKLKPEQTQIPPKLELLDPESPDEKARRRVLDRRLLASQEALKSSLRMHIQMVEVYQRFKHFG
jgi:hypothetical protein